ncbi:MAG: ATP-binding cassette domain-containing protein [Candidatus Schekmanbacteria bacterium]|nr:MAG: ATP-binding cassette domain-containing protein [Candidatus Schekmanbacteria bacterium]
MPLLRIENLKKSYDGNPALRGVSLQIDDGEIFGLLGPNGAGKTTLISILSSLFKEEEGTIEIIENGNSYYPENYKKHIGVVPQDISLYSELTCEENLIFFSRLYGIKGRESKDRTKELLSLAGLEKRAKDRVKSLSGGMKRRLNLVCGLVNSPSLLFLDEPTVGVDPQSREHIYSMIKMLKSQSVTSLLATHYMNEAETLCDRIAIMDKGKILMVHTIEEYMDLFAEKLNLEHIDMEKIFLHITGKELRD